MPQKLYLICLITANLLPQRPTLAYNIKPARQNTNPINMSHNCSTEVYRFMLRVFKWVYSTWSPHCGGTLLNPYWVLTAGHCLDTSKRYGVKYHLSYAHSEVVEGTPLPHPKYRLKYNDIGLIHLYKPIKESEHVSYVKLPPWDTNNNDPQCELALTMGYGRNVTQERDENLRCALVPTLAYSLCNLSFGDVPDKTLCTFSPDKGRSPCLGDSGGPLLCGEVQVGVVSWSKEVCARTVPKYPVVYSKVDRFLNFIGVFQGLFNKTWGLGRSAHASGRRLSKNQYEGQLVNVYRSGQGGVCLRVYSLIFNILVIVRKFEPI